MVLRASLERQRGAKLVANEDVREPQDAIERLEDPRADGLRHGRTHVFHQHGEGRQAELAAEHGRRLEHPLRRFRQAPHVRTDGLANAERELTCGEPGPGRSLVDRREELRDEERIALRDRQQPIGARYEVGCHGFEPGDQGFAPQATDRERDRFAPDPGDQPPHLLLRVQAVVPDRAGDVQARPLARMARDEVQHLEGGDVGGVEIVEHDRDRSLLGGPANQLGDRIEEPEARLRGIAMCRTAHLFEQDREFGRLGAGQVEERAERPPQSTKDLKPGVVGGCPFPFPGSTPRHDEPARLCSARQLLDEARLADAGLA
ncbi:MAG: hypothetical protein ABSF69_27935 [Polyangiaceae bacterium]